MMGIVAVCCGLPASATWKVTKVDSDEDGVPLITPVEELSVKPNGSLPEITDQV